MIDSFTISNEKFVNNSVLQIGNNFNKKKVLIF